MDYFVPQYELHEDVICAVVGRPARRVSAEQAFRPPSSPGAGRAVLPPAVVDFLDTDPGDPQAILSFCNRYGILGVLAWNVFPLPLEPEFRQKVEQAVEWHMQPAEFARHLDASKERPRGANATLPTDCESAVAQLPLSLTASVWLPEPLAAWRRAQMDLRSCLLLFASAQVLLLERHGTPAAQAEAGPYALAQLRLMAAALRATVTGRLPKELDQWFALHITDSPPSERLTTAMATIAYVSAVVWGGANLHVRARDDLAGWTVAADYPCLLNLLYMALLTSFARSELPRKCALPDCPKLAFPPSAWCTITHAATHRRRRKRAVDRWHLRVGEVAKMEALVRAEGLLHDAAAERVVGRRRESH